MGEQTRRQGLGAKSAPTYQPIYTGETLRFPLPRAVFASRPQTALVTSRNRGRSDEERRRHRRAPFPANLIEQLLFLQAGRCYICASVFKEGNSPTRDHVMPLSGGGGGFGNILLACSPCNNLKGDQLPTPQQSAYLRDLYNRLMSARAAEIEG